MPLFPTLNWEMPRNASEIGMITRQAILNQWSVPSIDFDSAVEVFDINPEVTTFIVSCFRSKFKVTIQELEG